jgi:hypothetical protein
MTTADTTGGAAPPQTPGAMPAREEKALREDLTPALEEFWRLLRQGGEYPARELHAVCLAGCGEVATAGRYVRRLRRKLLPFGWTVECVIRGRRACYRLAKAPDAPPWVAGESAVE